MELKKRSTVIFVHSTAHWEAIQQQRNQFISSPNLEQTEKEHTKKIATKKSQDVKEPSNKPSRLIGKEGSRRRQRWTNNNFSDHPNAVLYAEDLRPPGYNHSPKKNKKLFKTSKEILSNEDIEFLDIEKEVIPQVLSRHIRHDLKKAHISQGFVMNYEGLLLNFIDVWLNDPKCLDNVYLKIQVTSNNAFERYILHMMCRYYGFHSYSETNHENNTKETYIYHPEYTNYITKQDIDSIDYLEIDNWMMPEKSFYDYLFHKN